MPGLVEIVMDGSGLACSARPQVVESVTLKDSGFIRSPCPPVSHCQASIGVYIYITHDIFVCM